jgi:MoxR-like ATPase
LTEALALDLSPVVERYQRLRDQVSQVVVGQDDALRLAYITLLCSGHSLIEGVPGVAKTLLVRSLAASIGVGFGRVQFTPDLMPSDILGTPVLDPRVGEFHFRPGPIFTDLLLADEINRASPKTQAALLEAMQERTVTVDGERHVLGPCFTVFATQNPVEQEGTYPLPEAELDRFLFKIVVDYPSEEQERALLRVHHMQAPEAGPSASMTPVLEAESLEQCRELVRRIIVRDEIIDYVAELVRATRADFQFALGASPRAGLLLLRAAKAGAALEGRDYVLPEDVQEIFFAALRHRVLLDPASEVEGLTADRALERTLRTVTVPR